ncbi:MAG: type II toxin-antitoxin system HicA family toxin [Gammaproteobacteria bacterium]|nr:type II toxin-antitoxin system HicA family toxin [Gammaproteobacteria bacterium]
MKAKQFIQKLQRLGAEIIKWRGKGGHYLVKYKGRQTTVPVHGDADMSPVFIGKICKQLDIDPNEI